ncbi:MAG: hypothetical protein HYZ43_16125 [Flavobacteriia bacterium]|nr:hypothetical protein [Flavobacteriia bacterium]
MKQVLLVWIILMVGNFGLNAQLSGKRASIGEVENMFCGEEIYFHNDSIAMLMYGCERKQGIAFAKYRFDHNGQLCFTPIPNGQFNPIVRKYRCELPSDDEKKPWLVNSDLVFKTMGDTSVYFYDDVAWKLMKDSVLFAYGQSTDRLRFRNLSASGLCVNFPLIDGLFSDDFCFSPDEFSGIGDRYVIEVMFTTSLFRYDLFALKADFNNLNLYYANGQLNQLNDGKKKVIELENGRW